MSSNLVGRYVKIVHEAQRMWWLVLDHDGETVRVQLDSTPATRVEWNAGEFIDLPVQPTIARGAVMTFPVSAIMEMEASQ